MADRKNDTRSDDLDEMHTALIKAVLARIKSGEATAADFNVARQLLRDNGVSALATPGSPLEALTKNLPFQAED